MTAHGAPCGAEAAPASVAGELDCRHPAKRAGILDALRALPKVPVVEHSTVLAFVERRVRDPGLAQRGLTSWAFEGVRVVHRPEEGSWAPG